MHCGACSKPRAIAVSGPANSGKTTLICRLIPWLTGQGLQVAVLKHSHKDAARLAGPVAGGLGRAGTRAVGLAAPGWLEVTRFPMGDPPVAEVLNVLGRQADLVMVEGYKSGPLPKIVLTDPAAPAVVPAYPGAIAVVSRAPLETSHPVFHPEDTEALGKFILEFLKRKESHPA
jgi:molybdopterin-guanine dinucleotide biosynthesis protein MobB